MPIKNTGESAALDTIERCRERLGRVGRVEHEPFAPGELGRPVSGGGCHAIAIAEKPAIQSETRTKLPPGYVELSMARRAPSQSERSLSPHEDRTHYAHRDELGPS